MNAALKSSQKLAHHILNIAFLKVGQILVIEEAGINWKKFFKQTVRTAFLLEVSHFEVSQQYPFQLEVQRFLMDFSIFFNQPTIFFF